MTRKPRTASSAATAGEAWAFRYFRRPFLRPEVVLSLRLGAAVGKLRQGHELTADERTLLADAVNAASATAKRGQIGRKLMTQLRDRWIAMDYALRTDAGEKAASALLAVASAWSVKSSTVKEARRHFAKLARVAIGEYRREFTDWTEDAIRAEFLAGIKNTQGLLLPLAEPLANRKHSKARK